MLAECSGALRAVGAEARGALLDAALAGRHDDAPGAFIEVTAGAGGDDAADWARMLIEMYCGWAARAGHAADVVDADEGGGGGLRHGRVHVRGHRAYAWVRREAGVHRLVRISPFDSAGRRHTSFARVAVFPEAPPAVAARLARGSDVRVDVFRSSGPGGQSVNKSNSAVRVTHLATGVTAQCQAERSQARNLAGAMAALRGKLLDGEVAAGEARAAAYHAGLGPNAWGNQMRSYVLAPYRLVKDHGAAGHSSGDVEGVLGGAIEPFLEAALLASLDARGGDGGGGGGGPQVESGGAPPPLPRAQK